MLIYGKIYHHLVDNNILVDEQYGLRINSSIVNATHNYLTPVT